MKQASPKKESLCDSNYMTCWKRQSHRDRKKKRSVIARAWGLWREECRDRVLGIYKTVQLFWVIPSG